MERMKTMNATATKKGYARNQKAQALTELAVALLVLIPIALLLIDGVYVMIGASLNEFVCRDAARAAASGVPSSLNTGEHRTVRSGPPKDRATAVISKVYYSGLPMKVRTNVNVEETVRDVPPKSEGGAVDGDISVTTTIDIYPPVQVRWVDPCVVVLRSKHTVPITYLRPPAS